MKDIFEEKELGYLHEILFFSLIISKNILKTKYRQHVKVITELFLHLFGEPIETKRDIQIKSSYIGLLHAIARRSKKNIKKYSNEYRINLRRLIDTYNENQTEPAFSSLKKFVEEGIFAHIISKKEMGIPVFLSKEIENVLSTLKRVPEEKLTYLLVALQLIDKPQNITKKRTDKILNAFYSVNESPLLESSIFLTYNLAMKCPTYKREFLLVHYWLLKRSIEVLKYAIETKNESKILDDTTVEKLFRTSIMLLLCGYSKSLRLAHEEKINYIEHVIKLPAMVSLFQQAFDKHSSIKLWGYSIPLWFTTLISVVFILFHVFIEVDVVATIGNVVGFSLPFQLPFFLSISLFLILNNLISLYKLKNNISKDLEKGI